MAYPALVAVLGSGYTGMQVVSGLRRQLPSGVTILLINPQKYAYKYASTFGGTGIRVSGLTEIPRLKSADDFRILDAMERRFAVAAGEPDRRQADPASRLTLAFEREGDLGEYLRKCAAFGVDSSMEVIGQTDLAARLGPICEDCRLHGVVVEEIQFNTGRALRRFRAQVESLPNTIVWSPQDPLELMFREGKLLLQLGPDGPARQIPAIVFAVGAGLKEILSPLGLDWPELGIQHWAFLESQMALGVSATLVKRIGRHSLIHSRDPRWTRVLPLRRLTVVPDADPLVLGDILKDNALPRGLAEALIKADAQAKMCSLPNVSGTLLPQSTVLFDCGVGVVTPRATFSTDAAGLAVQRMMLQLRRHFSGKGELGAHPMLSVECLPEAELGFPALIEPTISVRDKSETSDVA